MTARAIVIGVGATAWGDGEYPPLAGVASDVERLSVMLRERGFEVSVPSQDPLMSGCVPGQDQLSRDCIAEALGALVDRTGPGDVSVIYFSGHGGLFVDTSLDEPVLPGIGRMDQGLVCSDRPLIDDWFSGVLWPRARSGARFVVIVDSCYSGTAVLRRRYAAHKIFIAHRAWGKDPDAGARLIRGPADVSEPAVETLYYRLVIAACSDTVIAQGDVNGGFATQALLQVLSETPDTTYRALWNRMKDIVEPRGQVPVQDYLGPDGMFLESRSFDPLASWNRALPR